LTLFTADHHGFYLNGSPFYPLIQDGDGSNTCLIRLPARLSDDLNWSKEKAIAEQMVEAGKYLFWEIDLGLDSFQFTPEDSASFYSFSLAMEEFSKQLWPQFQEHTFGVALYRGMFPPVQNFPFTHWEGAFSEWAAGDYELYSVQMLSEYLHRLISFLPDTVLPFALIDATQMSSTARVSQIFSTARFEHLHLAIKGATVPFSGMGWEEGWMGCIPRTSNNLGVLLPTDACFSASIRKSLDEIIHDLKGKNEPFRIVPEEKLTEQWDGLDKLIVISEGLSPQGKRKLLGFAAAGGEITTF
jgi:hypothetical protein